jgi:hypothetical protein
MTASRDALDALIHDADHTRWAYDVTAKLGEMREQLDQLVATYGLDRLEDQGTPLYDLLLAASDLALWREMWAA